MISVYQSPSVSCQSNELTRGRVRGKVRGLEISGVRVISQQQTDRWVVPAMSVTCSAMSIRRVNELIR